RTRPVTLAGQPSTGGSGGALVAGAAGDSGDGPGAGVPSDGGETTAALAGSGPVAARARRGGANQSASSAATPTPTTQPPPTQSRRRDGVSRGSYISRVRKYSTPSKRTKKNRPARGPSTIARCHTLRSPARPRATGRSSSTRSPFTLSNGARPDVPGCA